MWTCRLILDSLISKIGKKVYVSALQILNSNKELMELTSGKTLILEN